MKLTFISDTHSLHHKLPPLEAGDMLIHCGDFTRDGGLDDTADFADYIAAQPFTHKIVIAGNHDFCFEDSRKQDAEKLLSDQGIIYLNDSGITLEGFNIWGSPIQPEFFNWAFNRKRGADIHKHWALIPEDTHILLTHGPAFGLLDLCDNGTQAGCEILLEAINTIKPQIHAFGHIHEAYGTLEKQGTTFINACNMDEHYQVCNAPIVLEI